MTKGRFSITLKKKKISNILMKKKLNLQIAINRNP